MHGNRVPVHKMAVRQLAREDTEERDHHSSARVQERQETGAHVKGAQDRIDADGGARATLTPPGRNVFTAGYGARTASQAEEVCERKWSGRRC
jgi:hypothetical protein